MCVCVCVFNTLCTFSWGKKKKLEEETVFKQPNVSTSNSIRLKPNKIYMWVMILRNVTSCSLVDRLQRFGKTCCIRLQDIEDYEDCGNMPSKSDMSSHLPNCTTSHPRRPQYSPPRKSQICVNPGQHGRYSDYTIRWAKKKLWSDWW